MSEKTFNLITDDVETHLRDAELNYIEAVQSYAAKLVARDEAVAVYVGAVDRRAEIAEELRVAPAKADAAKERADAARVVLDAARDVVVERIM